MSHILIKYPTYWANTPHIEQIPHILNKYPTDWTNTPQIEQIPHRLNKCLSIFISYINIRQIYFNISCAFYRNRLWFPLWSFGIWNRCFNKCGGYIGSSWNGTFKTSFDSDKCEFECNIFKKCVFGWMWLKWKWRKCN